MTGRIEYSPDYTSERVRALRTQDVVNCEWCGAAVEIGTLRTLKYSERSSRSVRTVRRLITQTQCAFEKEHKIGE